MLGAESDRLGSPMASAFEAVWVVVEWRQTVMGWSRFSRQRCRVQPSL